MKFKGEYTLPPTSTFASIDPTAVSVQLITEDKTNTPIFDVVLPTTAFAGIGSAGWQLNGNATKWRSRDKTGSPQNGVISVSIFDRSAKSPGRVQLKIRGRDGSYPVELGDDPVQLLVFLGDDTEGGCAETTFTADDCRFVKVQTSLICKR